MVSSPCSSWFVEDRLPLFLFVVQKSSFSACLWWFTPCLFVSTWKSDPDHKFASLTLLSLRMSLDVSVRVLLRLIEDAKQQKSLLSPIMPASHWFLLSIEAIVMTVGHCFTPYPNVNTFLPDKNYMRTRFTTPLIAQMSSIISHWRMASPRKNNRYQKKIIVSGS